MDDFIVVIHNPDLSYENATGFFVDPEHILTCAHVLNNDDKLNKVYFNGEEVLYEIINIADRSIIDLALLKSTSVKCHKFARFTKRTFKRDNTSFKGYDYRIEALTNKTGVLQDDGDQSFIAFKGDLVLEGYSGSPLINDSGGSKAIGIVDFSWNFEFPEGGTAIPHSIIFDYCSKYKVKLTYEVTQLEQLNLSINQHIADNLNKKTNYVTFKRKLKLLNKDIEFDFEELPSNVSDKAPNLLSGGGGIGKSILLKRLAKELSEIYYENALIIFLNSEKWESLGDIHWECDEYGLLRQLLRRFSKKGIPGYIKAIKDNDTNTSFKVFLLIDGLNEITPKIERKSIIKLLTVLQLEEKFNIICTTRHFNKEDYDNWRLFEIKKLVRSEVDRILIEEFGKNPKYYSTRNLDYLSIPYFLNIALKIKKPKITSYSTFLSEHLLRTLSRKNHDQILLVLSRAAFDAYNSSKPLLITSIPLDNDTINSLLEHDVLQITDGGYKFEHQLINDLLVAYNISRESGMWNNETFDIITLDNPKLKEVIQMTLEQVNSQEDGELLLKAIYNWNIYAVLHCLKYVDTAKYPDELARALILIMFEKLFDNFNHTKDNVLEYLEYLIDKFDVKGFEKKNLDYYININPRWDTHKSDFQYVIRKNRRYFKSVYYCNWFKLFSFKDDYLDEESIEGILIKDSLLGWCCSNIIKRIKLTEANELQLRSIFKTLRLQDSKGSFLRWRIVHALGASNTNESVQLLYDALLYDKDSWVRYGAIRSLIEIELFNPIFSKEVIILNKIVEMLRDKTIDEKSTNELRVCLTTKVNSNKMYQIKSTFEEIIDLQVQTEGDDGQWGYAYNKFRLLNGIDN